MLAFAPLPPVVLVSSEPAPIPVVPLPAAPRPIPFLSLPPPSTELPDSIRGLAEAAFRAGDDAALDAVIKLARQTYPDAKVQSDALADQFARLRSERAARQQLDREQRLAAASAIENWKGELELGGSLSTGNTRSFGAYGSARLTREGLRWQNEINGRVEFQSTDNETIADRMSLAWQPSYKIDDGISAYGLGQFERDRFLGFSSRYTVSAGIGVALVERPRLRVNLYGGPAIRIVDDVETGRSTSPAGRASMTIRWKVSPTFDLSQDATLYLEEGESNAIATSAIETSLIGTLKAKLSYNVQYEESDIEGRRPIDTTSRVTLVYGF